MEFQFRQVFFNNFFQAILESNPYSSCHTKLYVDIIIYNLLTHQIYQVQYSFCENEFISLNHKVKSLQENFNKDCFKDVPNTVVQHIQTANKS